MLVREESASVSGASLEAAESSVMEVRSAMQLGVPAPGSRRLVFVLNTHERDRNTPRYEKTQTPAASSTYSDRTRESKVREDDAAAVRVLRGEQEIPRLNAQSAEADQRANNSNWLRIAYSNVVVKEPAGVQVSDAKTRDGQGRYD